MIEVIPNWHPLIVHFTIALLLTASALFVLGAILRTRPLGGAVTLVARWNLGLGVLSALVTLATGWQAYNTVAHDGPSHANMTVHMQWALGTAAVFVAAAAAAWIDRRRDAGAGGVLLALLVVGSGALGVTGWLGGENVYRYGLGVISMPRTDGHVHPGGEEAAHDHNSKARTAPGSMGNMPGMPSENGKDKAGAPSATPGAAMPSATTQPPEAAPAHKH